MLSLARIDKNNSTLRRSSESKINTTTWFIKQLHRAKFLYWLLVTTLLEEDGREVITLSLHRWQLSHPDSLVVARHRLQAKEV